MKTSYDYDVLAVRARLGRELWGPPITRPATGPFGVTFVRKDERRSVIITSSHHADGDGTIWLHASICAHPNDAPVPDYEELKMLRYAVWGENGWAFQVFAPEENHINIRINALHLWGRLDGIRIHPDFGWLGTI